MSLFCLSYVAVSSPGPTSGWTSHQRPGETLTENILLASSDNSGMVKYFLLIKHTILKGELFHCCDILHIISYTFSKILATQMCLVKLNQL